MLSLREGVRVYRHRNKDWQKTKIEASICGLHRSAQLRPGLEKVGEPGGPTAPGTLNLSCQERTHFVNASMANTAEGQLPYSCECSVFKSISFCKHQFLKYKQDTWQWPCHRTSSLWLAHLAWPPQPCLAKIKNSLKSKLKVTETEEEKPAFKGNAGRETKWTDCNEI